MQVLDISRNNNKQGNSARKLSFSVTSVGFSRMRQKYVFWLRLMMLVHEDQAFYSRKPPRIRTQHRWRLTPNIVGCYPVRCF